LANIANAVLLTRSVVINWLAMGLVSIQSVEWHLSSEQKV
jgi:hypothetical protein